MILFTTNIDKFKSEFPDIFVLKIPLVREDIQHEMMLNESFKENLCMTLTRKYGVFACSDRWLLTDSILMSHLSGVVDFGSQNEYEIQDYKKYFSRVPIMRDRVFHTYKEFCEFVSNRLDGLVKSYTVEEFGKPDLLKILKSTGGFIMSNIEESIRIAMEELGIDMESSDNDKVDVSNNSEDLDINEETAEDKTAEMRPVVYVKIKGDSVALIFDNNTEFKSRELGGKLMNVLSFKIPDVTSEKLQELELIDEEPKEKPAERVRSEKVDRVSTSSNKNDNTDSLTDLKNQKSALDFKIKEARSKGDVELVNSLRKQRRAIRNKINSIGE